MHSLFPTPSLVRLLVGLFSALWVLACSAADGSLESVSESRAALSSANAASLAHPEYDLNVPAGHWWMHFADATTIDQRRAQNYRLLSLDVVQVSPLRFSAALVLNTGVYQRTGDGWDAD